MTDTPLARALSSDLFWSLRKSLTAKVSALVLLILFAAATLAPRLGTLIRIGSEYLFSGIWWVVIFPSVVLVILVLAVNLLGDWLRDALNPKLRERPWPFCPCRI